MGGDGTRDRHWAASATERAVERMLLDGPEDLPEGRRRSRAPVGAWILATGVRAFVVGQMISVCAPAVFSAAFVTEYPAPRDLVAKLVK